MRGIVIAGTHSGCGKTTVTLGILAALKKKGLTVQSFKAGPDFIDSGLHGAITGRPSRNLDLWMCGKDYVNNCFKKHSNGVDVSIVEGVMGLYDGEFCTAILANTLNIPVILVIDAYGMAESAGALVKGFADFGIQDSASRFLYPNLQTPNSALSFAGVIFNRVASDNHYKRLKNSIKDIPVLGYLPRDFDFEIPHRHLGLTVAEECPISDENLEKLAEAVLKYVDIDFIFDLEKKRNRGKEEKIGKEDIYTTAAEPPYHRVSPSFFPTIAVAYDKAFCFYYEDNLELIRDAGAEIKTFSPIYDSSIPEDSDAIYIGGGYPELHAAELSKNTSMLKSIHDWADSGKPLYAECGGLMYLSQGIYDFDSNFFKMSGVFPFETVMAAGRSKLGYREIFLKEDCILGKRGNRCRGHEFHYSEIKRQMAVSSQQLAVIYSVRDGRGNDIGNEGFRFKNTLASYIHVHFGSNPEIAENYLNLIINKKSF